MQASLGEVDDGKKPHANVWRKSIPGLDRQ